MSFTVVMLHKTHHTKKQNQNIYRDCDFYFQLKMFLQARMLAYQDGLVAFCESQIKTARDTYTLLAKTMTVLKQSEE
jgi:hypothetical protein